MEQMNQNNISSNDIKNLLWIITARNTFMMSYDIAITNPMQKEFLKNSNSCTIFSFMRHLLKKFR